MVSAVLPCEKLSHNSWHECTLVLQPGKRATIISSHMYQFILLSIRVCLLAELGFALFNHTTQQQANEEKLQENAAASWTFYTSQELQ